MTTNKLDERGKEMDKALTKVQNYNAREISNLVIIEEDLISLSDILKEYTTKTKNYLSEIFSIKIPELKENSITTNLYNIVQRIITNNALFLSNLVNIIDTKPLIEKKISIVPKKGEKNPLDPIMNSTMVFGQSYHSLVDKYEKYFGKMEDYENYLINKEMKVANDAKNKEEDFLKAITETKKDYLSQLNDTTKLAKEMFEFNFKKEDELLGKYMEFFNMFFGKAENNLKKLLIEYQDICETFKILKENVNLERQNNINDLNNIYRKYPLLSLNEFANKSNTKNKPEAYKNISLANIENIIKEMESKGLELDYEQLKNAKMKMYFEDKFQLFFGKEAIKDEIKNEIINYLKSDEDNIRILFSVINQKRVEIKEISNEDNIIFLADIFGMMFDFTLRKGDIKILDTLLIIIITYYIMKEGKKIFADVYFKKKYLEKQGHKNLFNNPYFWEDYLIRLIQRKVQDIKNNKRVAEDKNKFIREETYSNVLTILQQIRNYDLGNNLEARFINLLETHDKITKEKAQEIKTIFGIKENN